MYSILLSDNNGKWKFLTNQDGTNYVAEKLEAIQFKVKELLMKTPLESVKVVKNCTITENIIVKEDSAIIDDTTDKDNTTDKEDSNKNENITE